MDRIHGVTFQNISIRDITVQIRKKPYWININFTVLKDGENKKKSSLCRTNQRSVYDKILPLCCELDKEYSNAVCRPKHAAIQPKSNLMGLCGRNGSEVAKNNIQNEPGQIFYLELDDGGANSSVSHFSEHASPIDSHFRQTSKFEGLSGKSGRDIANKNIQDEPAKVFFLELGDSGTTTSQSLFSEDGSSMDSRTTTIKSGETQITNSDADTDIDINISNTLTPRQVEKMTRGAVMDSLEYACKSGNFSELLESPLLEMVDDQTKSISKVADISPFQVAKLIR